MFNYSDLSKSPISDDLLNLVDELYASSKEESVLHWKNPGQTSPKELDRDAGIDQARAHIDIELCWVLQGKLNFPNLKILDVGCVTGLSTLYTSLKLDPTSMIMGVDVKENVEFANQKYAPRAPHQNLFYQTIESPLDLPLPCEGEKWSLISAFAFFSWIPKNRQVEVLKEMYRVLEPNGELLFRLQAIGERPYRQAADEVASEDKWKMNFEGYNPPFVDQSIEEFGANLKEAGFELTYVASPEEALSTTSFASKESLERYISCWLPHLSRLRERHPDDPQLCHEFCDQVVDRYCEIIGSNGSNIPLHLPGLLCTAKKIKQDEEETDLFLGIRV